MRGNNLTIGRREMLGAVASSLAMLPMAAPALGRVAAAKGFPRGFLWGASTAGHQVEGNNTNSDIWLFEHVKPSLYPAASGDACNFLVHWRSDLALLKRLGLKSFRFSLEWSRIEPEPGEFSPAMLDHYRQMIDECHALGITPVTTFNHFTAPRWFSARGGWLNSESADLFGRYCDRTARELAPGLRYVVTLNEPNIEHILKWKNLPPVVHQKQAEMRVAAAKACGSDRFAAFTSIAGNELEAFRDGLLRAHETGRAAIRAASPNAKIGLSIAIEDDQVVGDPRRRDEKRAETYQPWFETAKSDDFIAIQNYERTVFDGDNVMPPSAGAPVNQLGAETYAPSLANCVRYAHAQTGKPVFITEHGLATASDDQRQRFMIDALNELHAVTAEGIPVVGYMHWSFLDSFEWIFGYGPKFGLVEVDRQNFRRTPKQSAKLLGRIASQNALSSDLSRLAGQARL